MTAHTLSPGERALWNCAYAAPLEVVIDRPDGFGRNGEPEYLVRKADQPLSVPFPLPQYVLHVLGAPESASASEGHTEPLSTLPPLIGMVGRKRSGKDSCATVLVEEYGFQRVAFADLLKEMALDLNPIMSSNLINFTPRRLQDVVEARGGWEEAKQHIEVRRTLQVLGEAVREHLGVDIWVEKAMAKVQELREAGIPVVVSDVRFPNELDAIYQAGGEGIRVIRPGTPETDRHISETALDDYYSGYTIRNDGTLEDLRNEVREVAAWEDLQVKHTDTESELTAA